MLSIRGGNLQFYLNFALKHWGMKLDYYFLQMNKIWQTCNTLLRKWSEDRKNGLHQNLKSFYSQNQVKTKIKRPKIIQRSNTDHSQIIGRDVVKLLRGYVPHPPGFRHPAWSSSPWPPSMQILKYAMFSDWGQHYFWFVKKENNQKYLTLTSFPAQWPCFWHCMKFWKKNVRLLRDDLFIFIFEDLLQSCVLGPSIPVLGLERVEASHVKVMHVPLLFWFKYDILSWHWCKLRSVVVVVLSFQPSHPGWIRTWVANALNGRIRSIDAVTQERVRKSTEQSFFCFKTLHYS